MNGRSVMPLLSDEKLQRNWDAFVQISSSAALTIAVGATSVVAFAAEQSELRRIACRLGKAEVAEGMRGQQPPARGALQITALDQKRLDDVLDRIARLRQCRGHRFHADPTAAVISREGGEITPVHSIEACGIDLRRAQRVVGNSEIDRGGVRRGGKIPDGPQ